MSAKKSEQHHLTKGSWWAMRKRCTYQKHPAYHRYGGAGIRVCDRWMDFDLFVADMGLRPSKAHSIDRIDGTRGYEPGNCRWATVGEQHRNRWDNRPLTAFGKSQLLTDWSAETGIGKSTLRERLRRGWTPEETVSVPPKAADSIHRTDVSAEEASSLVRSGLSINQVAQRLGCSWPTAKLRIKAGARALAEKSG